jgi:Icc-related predicted phosphoesterase
MKLLVLSDLHVEFAAFQPDLAATAAADVVVLAGDIHQGNLGLVWARQAFPDKPIVYVAGNHEFYGQHWDNLLNTLRADAQDHGIHFLENDTITIDGVRFLGASLWTDFEFFAASRRSQMMRAAARGMNDYQRITADPIDIDPQDVVPGLSETASAHRPFIDKLTPMHTVMRHQQSLGWLQTELKRGAPANTVVVTHHYPHQNSTARRWANDPVTAAFGSTLSTDILTSASLWVHGHTHDSCDYRIGNSQRSVRVVCNPRGYAAGWSKTEFENPMFNPRLLVELVPLL